MLAVEHRVNTLEHLRRVPRHCGVEIDVRDYDGCLRLAHDPFCSGERLEPFLAEYQHALLIVNTKCDGLEQPILRLLRQYRVESFFFLDSTLPSLVKLARAGVHQTAVRFSEYEPVELALAFAGKAEWVWIDCFQEMPLRTDVYERLKRYFKLCLVSPELQRHPRERITSYRELLRNMPLDAVCTDHVGDWQQSGGTHLHDLLQNDASRKPAVPFTPVHSRLLELDRYPGDQNGEVAQGAAARS